MGQEQTHHKFWERPGREKYHSESKGAMGFCLELRTPPLFHLRVTEATLRILGSKLWKSRD